MDSKQAFPLSWPLGEKRTTSRKDSSFSQTGETAQKYLRNELSKMGAINVIVSSNAPVRNDGMMYADAAGRAGDPGVSVYFKYKGQNLVICCDTYHRIWENVYAIGKTINNLRAIERYGVSDFINRSFAGFAQLPESVVTDNDSWFEVLGLRPDANEQQIKDAFREQSKKVHPDRGGSRDEFIRLQTAYKTAMSQFQNATS